MSVMPTRALARDVVTGEVLGGTSSWRAVLVAFQGARASTLGIVGRFTTSLLSNEPSSDDREHGQEPPLPPACNAELQIELIYELLDAHIDTIEMGDNLGPGAAWQPHLEYLQALQRKARELLAQLAMDGRA